MKRRQKTFGIFFFLNYGAPMIKDWYRPITTAHLVHSDNEVLALYWAKEIELIKYHISFLVVETAIDYNSLNQRGLFM